MKDKLQEAAENMIIKSQNIKISLAGLMIEFHKEQSKEAIQELVSALEVIEAYIEGTPNSERRNDIENLINELKLKHKQ